MLIPTQSLPVRRSTKGARIRLSGVMAAGFGDLTLDELFARYTVIFDPSAIDCKCEKKELICSFTDDGGGKESIRTGVPCGKNIRPVK